MAAIPHCVQATELVYYPDMWKPLEALLKDVTQETRGVRMSGAAAANLCHLASGCIDAYYQFNLKPWVSLPVRLAPAASITQCRRSHARGHQEGGAN